MANGGSSAPEFIAWERFLLGWLSSEQVRCIENFDQGVFTSKLSSLSAIDNEAKTILIKQGGSKILVIESRRSSDLNFLSKEEEGVLVYTIDVNIRGNDGAANLVFNTPKIRKSADWGWLVGTLQSGETVTSGGIKVEILSSDASGDIVLRGGKPEGGPWNIGIASPDDVEKFVKFFDVTDGSVATSGDYEKGPHIVDPHTGLIAIGARSATVIGPDGAICDALATALMVDGVDAQKWIGRVELAGYSFWTINRHDGTAWSYGSNEGY
jgi:hypothetical protein